MPPLRPRPLHHPGSKGWCLLLKFRVSHVSRSSFALYGKSFCPSCCQYILQSSQKLRAKFLFISCYTVSSNRLQNNGRFLLSGYSFRLSNWVITLTLSCKISWYYISSWLHHTRSSGVCSPSSWCNVLTVNRPPWPWNQRDLTSLIWSQSHLPPPPPTTNTPVVAELHVSTRLFTPSITSPTFNLNSFQPSFNYSYTVCGWRDSLQAAATSLFMSASACNYPHAFKSHDFFN